MKLDLTNIKNYVQDTYDFTRDSINTKVILPLTIAGLATSCVVNEKTEVNVDNDGAGNVYVNTGYANCTPKTHETYFFGLFNRHGDGCRTKEKNTNPNRSRNDNKNSNRTNTSTNTVIDTTSIDTKVNDIQTNVNSNDSEWDYENIGSKNPYECENKK